MDSPKESSTALDQRDGKGDGEERKIRSARKPSFYLARAALAGATLYFVFDLSAGGRGLVDYIVITLVAGAVLYNLIMLREFLRKDASPRPGT